MIRRIPFAVCLSLAAVLLAVGALPAPCVADASAPGNAQDSARTDTLSRIARVAEPLDQPTIYRILCGGMTGKDRALSRHLWAVAGSLARNDWTPPRVTIRVVVSDSRGD